MNKGIDKTNTFEQRARMIKLRRTKCTQKVLSHYADISGSSNSKWSWCKCFKI